MVTANAPVISLESYFAIEKEMMEKGYFLDEYVMPEKIIETDLKCPVCDEYLTLSLVGNSHQIYCTTDQCVNVTVRGL